MKIKKKLKHLGGTYLFDGMSLADLKSFADEINQEYSNSGWDRLFIDIDWDYDDSPVYNLMGEREETGEGARARVLQANAYTDSLRAAELAQLAALKLKYEQ